MNGWMKDVVQSRDLLYMLTWRELRIRYKQSIMGFMWALLMPTIITLAGVLIRIAASRISGEALSGAVIATIAVKSLPWAFFVSSLRFGTASLTSNASLVTKIKFPRLVFPLSSVTTSLADLTVASPMVIILLPLLGVWPSWTWLWVPLLLLILVLFTAGVCVLLSAANLFFRDVKYLVEVIMTFAIFFTPVLYDADMVGRWRDLLLLNPVAPILEGLAKTVVLGRQPELPWIGYSAAMALLFGWGGFAFFRRVEPRFAESV